MNRPTLTLKRKPEHAAKHNANDVIMELVSKYPLALSLHRSKKPLAIGIHQQLFTADTGLSRKSIRLALAAYVRRSSYLKAIVAGVSRVNLDGSNAGLVTESEVMYSVELLSKRLESKNAN